jgi:hypothetical protein
MLHGLPLTPTIMIDKTTVVIILLDVLIVSTVFHIPGI